MAASSRNAYGRAAHDRLRPPRRRQPWKLDRTIGAVMAAALVIVGLLTASGFDLEEWLNRPTPAGAITTPAEPANAGEHRFRSFHGDGTPVGWYPCRPIPYWIGSHDLPAGGQDIISWVLAEISNLSGQRFEFKGYTGTVPSDLGEYPVHGAWIGWTADATTNAWQGHELEDSDSAVGLANSNFLLDGKWLTAGWAMLRSDSLPEADAEAAGVLRHEIGHLLGLDHVASEDEVMHEGVWADTWGPGDRRALWELGPSRGC